jgi:phage-related protein
VDDVAEENQFLAPGLTCSQKSEQWRHGRLRMPPIKVVFYRDDDGTTPLLTWLDGLKPRRAVAKCIALVELLEQLGPELRRPHADLLRSGIHELRSHLGTVQFRMLYFFHGKSAVISHGFVKKGPKVPSKEIDRAVVHKSRYEQEPTQHAHQEA